MVKNESKLKKLVIKVNGKYKKIGYPKVKDDITYKKNSINNPIKIKLPKIQSIPAIIVHQEKPNMMHISWGDRKIFALKDLSCTETTHENAVVKLFSLNGSKGTATLEEGIFNKKKIFWIKPNNQMLSLNGKEFVLEFCSKNKNENENIYKLQKSIYFAEDRKTAHVSFEGEPINKSTPQKIIDIGIYGIPGKALKLKNIYFGERKVKHELNDHNDKDHIAEYSVMIPSFEQAQNLSILADIENEKDRMVLKYQFEIKLQN